LDKYFGKRKLITSSAEVLNEFSLSVAVYMPRLYFQAYLKCLIKRFKKIPMQIYIVNYFKVELPIKNVIRSN